MPPKKPGMDVGMGGEQDNFSRREGVPLRRLLLLYFSYSTVCLMCQENGEPARMRRLPASYFRRPCGIAIPGLFGLAAEAAAEPIAVAIAAAAQEQDKPQAAVPAAAASAAVISAEEAVAASAAAAQQDNQPDNRGASPIVISFASTSTVCSS